jgi:hypothetical protein
MGTAKTNNNHRQPSPMKASRNRLLLGLLLALLVAPVPAQAAITEYPLPTPEGWTLSTSSPWAGPQRSLTAHKGLSSLPLAGQGVISATLGADSSAYRISAASKGFQVENPVQRLTARFGVSGVQVSSGKLLVGLSLRGVGYGRSLKAVGAVVPSAKSNRVTYARVGLSEWYLNGPLGLEQGFTIAKAPAGDAKAPLTLSMSLSGNARESLAADGQRLALSRADSEPLRYTGLTAMDVRGRTLRGWLELSAGRLLLRVDARGARYPLQIDPFIQQGGKLTGGGEIGEGEFGFSVALSADGNTALIGGFRDSSVGAAWVFTRSSSTWTQQGAKLTPKSGEEIGQGEFGSSVALSADGNTALIGGSFDNVDVGAAWVFTRSSSTWTQQGAKLTGAGESGVGAFGVSVALSGDGSTALIGGSGDNGNVGAAWVFTRSGSTWTQQGSKLTGSGESGVGQFGFSVALSGDGSTALISGYFDNSAVGAAWVFTRSGSTWSQQGEKLTGGGEAGKGLFGRSVALSADGNTALIGGYEDNVGLGAAWVFTRSGSTWSQQGSKLIGSEQIGQGGFGSSVALSADGNTALIGGYRDNSFIGAARVFMNGLAAPVNTGLPAISGTAQLGQTMSCSTGTWTGNPSPSFTYQWPRDGSGIGGATGSTYVVQAADQGHTLSCEVTATNSVGHQTATSLGMAIPPAPPIAKRLKAPLLAPVLGKTVNAEAVSGVVFVKLPAGAHVSVATRHLSLAAHLLWAFESVSKGAGFIPLSEARQIPVGSTLDTSAGVARITTATATSGKVQFGDFGAGIFTILQDRKQRGLTTLSIVNTQSRRQACATIGKKARAASKRLSSRVLALLKGSAHGKFTTRGQYSAATVRGTIWSVANRCDGTLTRVTRGVVSVRDFLRRKTITLRAGQRYLAEAP